MRPRARRARKRPRSGPAADELDSGDEATIRENRRKRARREGDEAAAGAGASEAEDEDEGEGGGGFVKTRSQRRIEYVFFILLCWRTAECLC